MTYSIGQQHLSYGPHFPEDENKITLDSIWLRIVRVPHSSTISFTFLRKEAFGSRS